MADITPFNFGIFTVRVIVQDNKQWFAAADVCTALAIRNHRDAVMHLDDDEKGVVSTDTLGGTQNISVVNESGLYALVLRSRKPEARKFAKWVTKEVLPSIRQTGGYGQQTQETTSRIDLARQLAHAATAQVYQAVFDAVLKDGEPPHFTRMLLGFTGNSHELRPHVQALEVGSIAMTLPQLAKAIRTDLMVPDTTLAHLAAACTARMAERAEAQARHAAAQSAAPAGITQGSLQLRQAKH
ncbi:BRO-N domain-containing protein [Comamonas jiangduensis]|uniref:BRO-N domain-containing protein n=1 Tax=Comamonas jiangduensis TaxID=1194168 RepID=UPI003BF7F59E